MSIGLVLDEDDGWEFRRFHAENVDRPCMDLDQIVYTKDYRPVAVLEVTHCDTEPSNPAYIAALDRRMNGHPQAKQALTVAGALGVHAYWVTHTLDFQRFGVRRLEPGMPWHFANQQMYLSWIHGLKGGDQ